MTREELLKRLQAGETDDFEVKEAAWGVPEDAYKTVSAFANSSGGWIVFGISEQDGGFVPTGVQNPDELQTGFLGACRSTKLSRPVDIRPKQLRIGDAHVLAFRVQPLHRFEKPLRVRVKKEWGTYIRLGTGDHRCNQVEETRFLRDASYEHFDSQIYEGSVGLKDLDLDAVAWLRGFANRDPNRTYPEDPEAFLRELSLLRDEGITNAAVLLFGKRGVAVALKPTGIVDFRQMYSAFEDYRITNGWDDREFCDGNVAEAARSLMGRFHRLTPQPFEMEPNGIQHKALSTDYLAVREALVNLLIHQDYTDKSRKAEILWYDDRIVFYNPGDSYVNPPEMLQGGFTETRNPLLLQTMRLAGFVEQVGQGVSKIVQVWEAAGRATPQILNDPGRKTYRLVLPLPWRAEAPVVIKSRRPPAVASAQTADEATEGADFRIYLKALVDLTDHINVGGISNAGSVKGAVRHPIERLYTPLSSREDGSRETRLAGLLPRHPRLLIEGQPGAGKTTFVRLAACMLARDALGVPCPDGSSWRNHYLGLDDHEPPPIPVMVRIADLVPLLTSASALRLDDRRWLLDLLENLSSENDFGVGRETWKDHLAEGKAILLLDGLDEVEDSSLRERIIEVLRDVCDSWTCPVLVTSRPIQTAALREIGFHIATIESFGDHEIRLFIDQWVTALYSVHRIEELGSEGDSYRQALLKAIVDWPRVRRMATNPVMLTCLAVVHWNEGRLPEGRSRVYAAVIRWLIAARRPQRQEAGFTDYLARRALARLALAMMTTNKGKQAIFDLENGAVAIDEVMRREYPDLDPEERRRRARNWLRFECLGSGIVEELPGSRVRFWHLTFQEYLAALQLAWRGDGEDLDADWWPLVEKHLDDLQWRETVELFPGCLLDEGGEGRVDKLLDRVLALRGSEPELAVEARVAGIVGRLLEPLSVYQYRPRPEIDTDYRRSLERSMAIFEVAGAVKVPVKDRLTVAKALGRGGDPRLHQDNLLEVPGTGGWRLGKYPVTVEEYQRFVEHRGYESKIYWAEEGWVVREKERWEEPKNWNEQLNDPSRPVAGVSWYEADAYCRWLSQQRGRDLRLPPRDVWVGAATREEKGPRKKKKPKLDLEVFTQDEEEERYPWGKEKPTIELRAHFTPLDGEPVVSSPVPVGLYPAGAGPYGHCDLAGNVWEWCADGPEKTDDENKFLRGGSWQEQAEGIKSERRRKSEAIRRNADFGFRLSASPDS